MVPSKDVLKLQARGVSWCRDKLAAHAYRPKSVFPTLRLSHVTDTIYNLVHIIIRVGMLDAINNRFPLLNGISLSFRIFSSVKEVYEFID